MGMKAPAYEASAAIEERIWKAPAALEACLF
jgi:hypothetical protein